MPAARAGTAEGAGGADDSATWPLMPLTVVEAEGAGMRAEEEGAGPTMSHQTASRGCVG